MFVCLFVCRRCCGKEKDRRQKINRERERESEKKYRCSANDNVYSSTITKYKIKSGKMGKKRKEH